MTGLPRHLRVVAHEATRTGGPSVLLHLLRHLKSHTPVRLSIRFEASGPLLPELMALDDGPHETLDDPPSAVLVNSALAAASALAMPGVPAMIYVHEDRAALDVLPERAATALRSRYRVVACVSPAAARDLADFGVPSECIRILPPAVPAIATPDADAIAAARRVTGAHAGQALVLACGEASWRKGADLFAPLARRLAEACDVRCVWVGLRPRPFARLLDSDGKSLTPAERVVWVGEVADAAAFLAAADVIVVSSRNDPQPLVPIEGGQLGTPTVGFHIGGLRDLAGEGAALTVPYPDVRALGERVIAVLADRALGGRVAGAARARWYREQRIEVAGPRFLEALRQTSPELAPMLAPGSP